MATLKSWSDGNMQQRNFYKATLSNEDDDRRRRSLFGSYPNLDTILWLKQISLDPCKKGASWVENKKSCDRILNVRKVMLMTNTESPRRKRKLQQFLKSKLATASRVDTEKQHNRQIRSKLSRGHSSAASSDSYLLNSADSGESFNRQVVQNSRISGSLLTSEDTDESVSCHLLDAADDSYSSSLKEPEKMNVRRVHIPFGPGFQADVPDWTEANVVEGDQESLRWIRTRVWPVRCGNSEISFKEIGRGRSNSCSCASPGSSDCIKHHILEKRFNLQSEIGPAFLIWKFNEMAEV